MQFKRTLLFLIIIIFLATLLPLKSSKSKIRCAGYDPSDFEPYQFFEPLSFEELSVLDSREESEWKGSEKSNLEVWKKYFNSQVSTEAIRTIIYEVSSQDMQDIRAYVQNPSSGLASKKLANNALIRYWQRNPDLATIDYIFFAKICEPHVKRLDYWEDKKAQDTEKMQWLYTEGQKYYRNKAKNNFLKMRYAYQIVRLAHYAKDYQKAIQLFDKFVKPLFSKSTDIVKYWALGHKAGALHAEGQKGKAAYIFAQIFDVSPSRRLSSFLSFEVSNQDQWNTALRACRNTAEKVNLYVLRALDKNSNAVEEMQNIYQIAPSSEKLDLLLVREINKLEQDLLGRELSKNLLFFEARSRFPKKEALVYLASLKILVEKVLQDDKVRNKSLWYLAQGYLSYLNGDIPKAKNIFQSTQNQSDANLKRKARIFGLALEVSTLKSIDSRVENELYEAVISTKHEHLKDMTMRAFGRLYVAQGELGKAYLCKPYTYQPYDLRTRPDKAIIENLIQIAEKLQKTLFEKQNTPSLDVLLELKATILFGEDKLDEAITFYDKVPKEVIGKLKRNPFAGNIHDYGHSKDPAYYLNRKSFAQQLQSLKKSAKSAEDYLKLGNAYYNMTFFGNAWYAIDYFRSSSDFHSKHSQSYNGENLVVLDASKAKDYYRKAIKIAEKKRNREVTAKALFMLAKCEQNEYYQTVKRSWGNIKPNYDLRYRQAFAELKKSYINTKYYEKVLKECSYFYNFVRYESR